MYGASLRDVYVWFKRQCFKRGEGVYLVSDGWHRGNLRIFTNMQGHEIYMRPEHTKHLEEILKAK